MVFANRSFTKRLTRAALLLLVLFGLSTTAHAVDPPDDVFAVLFAGGPKPTRYEWQYPIELSLVPRMGPRDVIGEGPFAVAYYNEAARLRAAGDPRWLDVRKLAERENHRFLRTNVYRERVPLKLTFPEDPKLSSLRFDELPREIAVKLKDGRVVPTMLGEELNVAVNEYGYARTFVIAPDDPNSIILYHGGLRGRATTIGRGALRAGPAVAMIVYGFVPQESRTAIIKNAGQPDAGVWSQIAAWGVIAGDLAEGPIFGDFFGNRDRARRFFGIGEYKPPTPLERAQAETRARQNDAAFQWLMANREIPMRPSPPVVKPRGIQLTEVKGKLYDQNGKYAGPAYPGWQKDLERSNSFRPNTGASSSGAGPTQTKTDTDTGTETQTGSDTETSTETKTMN